jgi:hypothetical protein
MDNIRNPGTNPDEYGKLVQLVERRDLDMATDVEREIASQVSRLSTLDKGKFQFIRILSIARTLPTQKAEAERYLMEDVISGLHGSMTPFVYLILGSKSYINVYLGIPAKQPSSQYSLTDNLDVLISSLCSTFPNIEIKTLDDDEVEKNIHQFFRTSCHCGIMTGIPTPKIGIEEYGTYQIERLLRGLYQQEFGYMVICDPIVDHEIIRAFEDVSSEIKDKSIFVKESRQYTQTTRLTLSGESLNKEVQYYIELLETIFDKLKLAKAQGMWRTTTYFFSPNPATLGRMKNLLKGVFGGDKSVPETIRTLILTGNYSKTLIEQFRQLEVELNYHSLGIQAGHPLQRLMKYKFMTPLNSRDLATLTHLPKEEMPGYDVKDTARFGVCLPSKQEGIHLNIGEVLDRGLSTGNFCSVKVTDLVKHGLIAGVTGSGKTNTCFNLLSQLWNGSTRTPFLVIEPAKTEYRALLRVDGFHDMQIFTLGDETTSQFRLNPFEVIEGVQIQSHIDHLRSVFNAAFIMYAPMPYVLERCIHEVYQDKGWDLTNNKNRYARDENCKADIFPTLTDLYQKIDSVVNNLGYEDRITMDVKAALKTRIGSLCIGGKGAMLDTRLSIPIELLLSKPTILELQCIGDDEEKSFIIGLLLTRLYEFREVEHKRMIVIHEFKHLTLIEEAHRLLTRTSPDSGNLEVVGTKAKGVESFCNILSEIRAFGEGILIAEQIPSKLAADAIKNSNLKIMHRLVAKDDRDFLGSTMNLSEEQNNYVSIIETGEAVVFCEGFHEPFLVKVPYFPDVSRIQAGTTPGDAEVRQFMSKSLLALDYVYAKQKGCVSCQNKCKYLDIAKRILDAPEPKRAFTRYLLAAIENKDAVTSKYSYLKDIVLREISALLLTPDEIEGIMFCFFINAGSQFFRHKRELYKISSPEISPLLDCYFNTINSLFAVKIKTQLSLEAERQVERFQQLYQEILQIETGPFPGCNEFCKHKCLFRFEVEQIIKNPSIGNGLLAAIKSGPDSRANVRNFCLQVARGITLGNSPEFIENIALCFFIQVSIQWSVEEILANIRQWFLCKSSPLKDTE